MEEIKLDLFYPDAINWMWNYCTNLGKFTDSRGYEYDLGVFVDGDEVSAAIVCGNEDGDYYSGDLNNLFIYLDANEPTDANSIWYYEKYNETLRRAKEAGLI